MKETLIFPDYKETILNVTGSILKHYRVKTATATLPLLDKELAKNYRNVVLILVDAMGSFALKSHLGGKGALNKDKQRDITSVFPSTTVSATTSVLSGRAPIETGWLGWCQYFIEEQKSVILFTNEDYYDETVVIDHPVAGTALPYQTIYRQIEEASPAVKTWEIFPAFRTPENDTFLKECQGIQKTARQPGRNFIYCYWDKLDTLMHIYGASSAEAKAMMEQIDAAYATLLSGLDDDTIVITIADHGQVDVFPLPLWNYRDLQATFRHEPSIESRATAFFIKPEQKKIFEDRFKDHFRDKYILYTVDEAVQTGLFGPGVPHPRFREFLGDYLAVAIDHYYFQLFSYPTPIKGQHAGILKDEMLVPLVIHSPRP
jgi:hypothetical protein